MGFKEPQLLVDPARNLGEQVRGGQGSGGHLVEQLVNRDERGAATDCVRMFSDRVLCMRYVLGLPMSGVGGCRLRPEAGTGRTDAKRACNRGNRPAPVGVTLASGAARPKGLETTHVAVG